MDNIGINYKEEKIKSTVKLYAHMLNVSKEGLRFFEEKGLLNPERDPDSGYRIYGGDESTIVISCKKLRKYGFSLEKAVKIIREKSSETVLKHYSNQYELLQKEIEEKKRILASMDEKISQLQEICLQEGKFSIVMRPATYLLPTRVNKSIMDSPQNVKAIRRWNGHSPYTDTVIVWPLHRLLTSEGDVVAGQILKEDAVHDLSMEGAVFLPETKCLYTVNSIKGYLNSSYTMFDDMLRYMKQNGYCPSGDAVARTVRVFMDDAKEYHYISQLWIPVA